MTKELPRRLAPKPDTLRQLFLKSGNLCAFPGCHNLMMNIDGEFIGQICHIEAAEPGGERFNKASDNEARRGFENLMLMCGEHHVVTNNVDKYPAQRLRELKARHEARFADPSVAMLETLRDWTLVNAVRRTLNMRRANAFFEWEHDDDDLRAEVANMNEYAGRLAVVPDEVRAFLVQVVERAQRTGVIQTKKFNAKLYVPSRDLALACKLPEMGVVKRAWDLNRYRLGGYEDDGWNCEEPSVRIDTHENWAIWPALAEFGKSFGVPLSTFAVDLDFSSLDS